MNMGIPLVTQLIRPDIVQHTLLFSMLHAERFKFPCATLKSWEESGDEARIQLTLALVCMIKYHSYMVGSDYLRKLEMAPMNVSGTPTPVLKLIT